MQMRAAAFLVAAWAVLCGSVAGAQSRSVDAHFFRPALFSRGIFGVEHAGPQDGFQPGFKFYYAYESSPLRLTFPQKGCSGSSCLGTQDIIDSAHVFHLQGQLGLGRWLELAIDIPVARHSLVTNPADDAESGFELLSHGDPRTNIPPANAPLMDLRAGLKFNAFHSGGVALALAVETTLPFGDEEVFAGDRGFTVKPTLLASLDQGPVLVAANLGYMIREKTVVTWDDPDTPESAQPLLCVDDEFVFGLGMVYRLHRTVGLAAEVFGTVPVAGGTFDVVTRQQSYDPVQDRLVEKEDVRHEGLLGSVTMEVLGGLLIHPRPGITLSAGAGAGVVGEERRTALRIFGGVAWLPGVEEAPAEELDRDGDGVVGSKDRCPSRAEDKDGYQDDDGCPEPDNDDDGILDRMDRCPNEAEDSDRFQDEDGCPDLDNDGDGVPDANDGCPNKAEDKDGFQDGDGCPDLDNDGDGIADADDKCPNRPETRNNFQDDDGCPDDVAGGVSVRRGQIHIPQQILFRRGSRSVRQSTKVLDEVYRVIASNPQMGRIRIEGHADSREGNKQRVSIARANGVRDYLVKKGIPAGRLQAVGYGARRQVAASDTKEGRAKNRRVELIIIQNRAGDSGRPLPESR